jgi:hypothetical protein
VVVGQTAPVRDGETLQEGQRADGLEQLVGIVRDFAGGDLNALELLALLEDTDGLTGGHLEKEGGTHVQRLKETRVGRRQALGNHAGRFAPTGLVGFEAVGVKGQET